MDEALGIEDPAAENGFSSKLNTLLTKIKEMRAENVGNKCVVISQWTR